MDSISYLADPTNPTITASVVQQYSKFELQEGISKSWDLSKTEYDRDNCNNDDSARNWLLNQLTMIGNSTIAIIIIIVGRRRRYLRVFRNAAMILTWNGGIDPCGPGLGTNVSWQVERFWPMT
jgi:hypothetical protein